MLKEVVMIIKMSLSILLYVSMAAILWRALKDRKMTASLRILVGVAFGVCSVFSTHYGVDYGTMMLNVRDLGPLTAGLFFDPVSGILAGLIGGIERYIAGTFWGIGSYTRVACAISTCLAGFLAALLRRFFVEKKTTNPLNAFFVGSVTEVFHMYSVFFTHRDNMEMAFFVVSECAVPMILFSGIGLAVISMVILRLSGKWSHLFRRRKPEEIRVSGRFQGWLMLTIFVFMWVTFALTYSIQTRTAFENSQKIMEKSADNLRYLAGRILSANESRGNSENNKNNENNKSNENSENSENNEINEDRIRSMLNNLISSYQVGAYGGSFVVDSEGEVTNGKMKGAKMSEVGLTKEDLQRPDSFFTGKYFGTDVLYRIEQIRGGYKLLLEIPLSEVFWSRNILSYETALADILLFSIVYAMIYLLMQVIVVKNLNKVNDSLAKITGGDLEEVVDVRSSLEFASLSDDINETVDTLKGYISEAEHRYEKELEMARTIQLSALPKNFVFSEIREIDMFALTEPAREVGGDFYDFFFVGMNRLAIVIADVSGKGIPAALFMMRSKASIRSLAETGSSPGEIFYKVNNLLCEGNDADMFVTVWIGIVDLTTGEVCCANAGHEYPVLKRVDGSYEIVMDRHGLPIAAMEEMWYTEYYLTLGPGDKLFLYTDGVPEAINENEEQYGTNRMLAALNTVMDEPMENTLFAVRNDMSSFVGKADQFDDITMLGFMLHNYVPG